MSLSGNLVVLEGPDGVGKTTLARILRERLQAAGVDCVGAAFPGNEPGSLGQLVHRVHHDLEQCAIKECAPAALQLLHVAAHVDSLQRIIVPALQAGRVVVLDRFWWSTFVYGREAGLDEEAVRAVLDVEMHFWRSIRPCAIFLLMRSAAHCEYASYSGIAERYRELAQRQDEHYPVHLIENDSEIHQTFAQLWAIVVTALGLASTAESQKNKEQLGLWHDGDLPTQPQPINVIPSSLPPPPPETVGMPDVFVWRDGILTTRVFDTYWRFAAERQNIFFRRLAGDSPPWTTDAILQEHKFTNAYRASDRVSQFLIRHVIRHGDQSRDEMFFRVMLFKLFNRIDTWRYLESKLGTIRWSDFSFERYDAILSQTMAEGRQVYSAAYIMPSARVFGHERKHSNHLRLLELMMREDLPSRLQDAKSMAEAFALIRKYHSIGDFLAYQYVTDLNYSDIINFTETEFVVAGPGARDGIRKCFKETGQFGDADIIKLVTESQEREFERLGISFQTLWGRSLQYIDCQNLFCEVDKYARVFHPDIAGLSGRTRIKQKFNACVDPIEYIFPKKWGLDNLVGTAKRPAVIGRGQLSMF